MLREFAKKLIWLRLAQLHINTLCRENSFRIPVHLALGHEAIAVAVDHVMAVDDALFLTHRNIHYNLIRQGSLKEELDEYYLKPEGLGRGMLGSMNLFNSEKSVIYTSSILANNLPVATGYALSRELNKSNAVTFVVTGDGAIEEGAFYESLLFMKSHNLKVIVIVENNQWSLATSINQRRSEINLSRLCSSLGIDYENFENNDVEEYAKKLTKLRNNVLTSSNPLLLEVSLETLGHWSVSDDTSPAGRFINYHCGASPYLPSIDQNRFPLISESGSDPLYWLTQKINISELVEYTTTLTDVIKENLS